jgi:hypothetical protein
MNTKTKYFRQAEVNTILDNADLPAKLTLLQGFHVCCWLMFNYNKILLFCQHLQNGKTTFIAYLKTVMGEREYYSL